MTSGPASHVKPVTKQTFVRASPGAAREAAGEALPNGAEVWRVILALDWLMCNLLQPKLYVSIQDISR